MADLSSCTQAHAKLTIALMRGRARCLTPSPLQDDYIGDARNKIGPLRPLASEPNAAGRIRRPDIRRIFHEHCTSSTSVATKGRSSEQRLPSRKFLTPVLHERPLIGYAEVIFVKGSFWMLPWIHLATASTPDGGTLRLLRRGQEYSIRLHDGNELMNSRLGASEEALAVLALDRSAGRQAPCILIGGLGMGFTLRAALAVVASDARLIVSEIMPELIAWAEEHMADVFGDCLVDPRVEVKTGDVGALIHEATAAFDAILLDVDNGPDGLTHESNDALYGEIGLRAARRALTPGGVLAVWSAGPDPEFSKRLSRCGFETTSTTIRATHSKRGARHTVWLAIRDIE